MSRCLSLDLTYRCAPNRIKAFANLPESGIRKRQRQQRSENFNRRVWQSKNVDDCCGQTQPALAGSRAAHKLILCVVAALDSGLCCRVRSLLIFKLKTRHCFKMRPNTGFILNRQLFQPYHCRRIAL